MSTPPPDSCPALATALPLAPAAPGVYLFKDAAARVLYVGKAIHLKNRLGSYLTNLNRHTPKTLLLLSKTTQVDYLLTRTEREALILERNLIKEHRPRFNVVLRDDKNYLCLRLDVHEAVPRLALVRRFAADGAKYFGPYVSSTAVREMLKFMQRVFRLRRCRDRGAPRRRRPCLNYQLGLCLGPCAGLVSPEDYRQAVQEALMFLQGHGKNLLHDLEARMQTAAAALEFEIAARLRDRLLLIKNRVLAQQNTAAPTFKDQDVLGLAHAGEQAVVLVLMVRGGLVTGSLSYDFSLSGTTESETELLAAFLNQYYTPERFLPAEILLPFAVPDQNVLAELLAEQKNAPVRLFTAKTGPRRQLLDLATDNAQAALKRLQETGPRADPLEELHTRLKLPTLPQLIHCLDISNLQGRQAVGSLAVFRAGRPDPAAYRRFVIREVPEQNDPAMLAEVIRRAYGDPERPRPDLLVIDGGRSQLAVVALTLADLGLTATIPFLGLAKEGIDVTGKPLPDRIYLPGRKNPFFLPQGSAGLLMLMHLRDEAHRVAIGHHRQRARQQLTRSVLTDIPGLGVKRRQLLLQHFGTVEALRRASREDLGGVTGLPGPVAQRVYDYFSTAGPPSDAQSAPGSDRNGAAVADS